MMSKLRYIFPAILLFVPLLALAQGGACTPGNASGYLCNALAGFGATNIEEFIVGLFVWLSGILGTLALVMMVFSGARMIFSQGNSGEVAKAKSSMAYSIAGFAIILLGYVIISAVQYFIRVRDLDGAEDADFFVNPLMQTDLQSWVESGIRNFLGVLGAIAIMYLVIGGFRYVTSGPNEEAAKSGKNTVTWALAGLISVIFSYLIITVVLNTLGSANTIPAP